MDRYPKGFPVFLCYKSKILNPIIKIVTYYSDDNDEFCLQDKH